ncbi:hypothetical protein DCL23_15975 [Citrobacter freundii]|nr:hypothetical protein DCL23_15975 [Citrobacter freundii]
MQTLIVDETEFVTYLIPWLLSQRNLVTLPQLTTQGVERKLSVVSINNTKLITLSIIFYTYESAMAYYGKLSDHYLFHRLKPLDNFPSVQLE